MFVACCEAKLKSKKRVDSLVNAPIGTQASSLCANPRLSIRAVQVTSRRGLSESQSNTYIARPKLSVRKRKEPHRSRLGPRVSNKKIRAQVCLTRRVLRLTDLYPSIPLSEVRAGRFSTA